MAKHRNIDLEFSPNTGISGWIPEAIRHLDDECRTVLCIDADGNEAIVLRDSEGVVRVYRTRQMGRQVLDEVRDAIREGIHPFYLCEPLEPVPLVPGAIYPHPDLRFRYWIDRDGRRPGGDEVAGYHPDRYFEDGRYLGPDQHGIEPVMCRIPEDPEH